jgi:pimeloyl-ACP methyl ester carboxylesterase
MTDLQNLCRPDRTRIAYRRIEGREPGILWLSGFRSDMKGTRASHLAGWAERDGRAFLGFDCLGHGASPGDFLKGTIGRWRLDTLTAPDEPPSGPQFLVRSSMRGWIGLLVASGRPERTKSLILVAPRQTSRKI